VQNQDDRDTLEALRAEQMARSDRAAWWSCLTYQIKMNEPHALAYLGDYVAGVRGLPVDPVSVACQIALASRFRPHLRPLLENLTTDLADRSIRLEQTSPWWHQEVFWGWPGLPRLTRGRDTSGGVHLRQRMIEAVPALTANHRPWYDLLFHGEGAPWASLSTVNSMMNPHPP
jgi:hypothetical protein